MAEGPADIAAAQDLRARTFRAAEGEPGRDADRFDAICAHVLVEEVRTGRLVCCFRLLPLEGGAEIGQSYSAQYYELSALEGFQSG